MQDEDAPGAVVRPRSPRWEAVRRFLPVAAFAALLVAHVAAARHLDRVYPWSWSWSELLVDYQGGFSKRGLLGQAAYLLRDAVPPDLFILAMVSGAYVLASAGLTLALRLPETLAGWLFLVSPTGWLFPLLNPTAYGRKDAFIVAALVASMIVVGRRRRATATVLLTMAIFALAGLLVETALFYYPLVVAAILSGWRERPMRWRLAVAAAAATFTLGFLLLTLRAAPVDTAGIARSWGRVPYEADDTGALCCLNFTIETALATGRAALPSFGGYALAGMLGLLPAVLVWIRHPPRRADTLTSVATAAGLLIATSPFALAFDWGRYLYLWLTAVFLWAWTTRRGRPRRAARPLGADDVLIRAAFVFLYASTWQTLAYPTLGLSPLVPGALFRNLGASMSKPPPN